MKNVTACIVLLWSSIACAAEQREDFAYSAPLKTEQSAAAYQTPLTADVYRRAVYADLRDLRVFNGGGEVVPYALRQPSASSAERHPLVSAPIFPLHGDERKALEALRVMVTSDGKNVSVQTAAAQSQPAPLSGYLVDLRGQKDSIVALELVWREPAPEFSNTVSIAASDDLAIWRTVISNASVVNLQFAGQQLQQHRIEFSATHVKFLRINWANAAVNLQSVNVEPVSTRVETQRLEVEGIGTQSGSDSYEFDIGVQAPIDRLSVRLPEINSLVQATFWSRPNEQAQWRRITQSTLYRLQRDDHEIDNVAIVIAPNLDRYWRMTIERNGGIGSGVPRLRMAFVPARLTFVARGAPPFTLNVGNNLARDAESSLTNVLESSSENDPNRIAPANANIGEFVEVGGKLKLAQRPPTNWKNWVLWSVLIVGVALLGLMARRLLREMAKEPPPSA
ncbi:MAG TPA: DUF3999 domain-containing protein [Steroidobacteraceae bacterium]|nr:DUF3999 domain-containing protein [Steroidobacteraceae bacterium]